MAPAVGPPTREARPRDEPDADRADDGLRELDRGERVVPRSGSEHAREKQRVDRRAAEAFRPRLARRGLGIGEAAPRREALGEREVFTFVVREGLVDPVEKAKTQSEDEAGHDGQPDRAARAGRH